MIFFIELHRKVAAQALERPLRDLAGLALDGKDAVSPDIGAVYVNVPAGLFHLKGFRMAARLQEFSNLLLFYRVNKCNAAVIFTVADHHELGSGVIAQVIRVGTEIERLAQLIRSSIVNVYFAVFGVGDDDLIDVGNVQDSLGLRKTLSDGVDHSARER